MATDCQTATQSGGSERQNLGEVNSFAGKKGVNLNYFLFCEIHGIYCME